MAHQLFNLDPSEDVTPTQARADRARFRRAAWWVVAAVAALWWIKLFEWLMGRDFSSLGVTPGNPWGLVGIITAPLLHGSWEHLISNTLPLLILGTLAVYAYPKATARALPLIWVLSGLGTWLIGRPNPHIGASGVAHGLMFFLFVLGLLRWDRRAVAVALVTFLMYGGMLMTILPREAGVSWEYHLSGAIAGVIAAVWWRKRDPLPPRKKYSWEIEEELAAQAAEEQNQFELPRPDHVPVLWVRPDRDEQSGATILPFPDRRRPPRIDDEPPTQSRH